MKSCCIFFLGLTVVSPTTFAAGFYGVGEVTHLSASPERDHFNRQLAAAGAEGLSRTAERSGNQWRLQGGYRFKGKDFEHVSGLGDSHKTGKMGTNLISAGFAYDF